MCRNTDPWRVMASNELWVILNESVSCWRILRIPLSSNFFPFLSTTFLPLKFSLLSSSTLSSLNLLLSTVTNHHGELKMVKENLVFDQIAWQPFIWHWSCATSRSPNPSIPHVKVQIPTFEEDFKCVSAFKWNTLPYHKQYRLYHLSNKWFPSELLKIATPKRLSIKPLWGTISKACFMMAKPCQLGY